MRTVLRRIWNAFAWIPAIADRRGLRWMLSGKLIGAPIVVLVHRGRRSGRLYRTPVEALAETDEEIVVSPMRGRRGDWYRNVVAGGLVDVRLRGESLGTQWRELSLAENEQGLRAYLDEHPLYGRVIVASLMRLHGLRGDPVTSVARTLPMLAIRRLPG